MTETEIRLHSIAFNAACAATCIFSVLSKNVWLMGVSCIGLHALGQCFDRVRAALLKDL